jgi:hypothetical protein
MHWHALQLHGVAQWVGPDAGQPLTPRSDHLRATTALSAHRRAPAASSRPKCMVTAREDRQEDGLLTVARACPRSRSGRHPGRGGHPVALQLSWPILAVSWSSALPRHCDPCQLAAAAPMSTAPWRPHTRSGWVCGRRRVEEPDAHSFTGGNAPGIAASSHLRCGHLQNKGWCTRGWVSTQCKCNLFKHY